MKLEPGIEQTIGTLAIVELEAAFLALLSEPPGADIAAKHIGDRKALGAVVALLLVAMHLTREKLGLAVADPNGPPIH